MKVFVWLAAIALFILGVAAPVSAAVSLNPTTATAGNVFDFVFTVTNQTQSPAKEVTVSLPTDAAVVSANATAPSGWTSVVYAETGTVSSVVFSGGTLAPAASASFTVTFAPPSTKDNLFRFTVKQKYADGSSTTPDIVTLNVDSSGATTTTSTEPLTTTTASAATTSTTVPTALPKKKTLSSTIGEVLIAVGLAVGVTFAMRARRRR